MPKAVKLENGDIYFSCPGCGAGHALNTDPSKGRPCWTFNGDFERPTFTPSILARWTFGENHEPRVCHSFVTDGNIQFLGDCTHALAGQTVPLEDD
jgi:hypothetical protein